MGFLTVLTEVWVRRFGVPCVKPVLNLMQFCKPIVLSSSPVSKSKSEVWRTKIRTFVWWTWMSDISRWRKTWIGCVGTLALWRMFWRRGGQNGALYQVLFLWLNAAGRDGEECSICEDMRLADTILVGVREELTLNRIILEWLLGK